MSHFKYRTGLGPMHIAVLQAITVGVHDVDSLRRYTSQNTAGPAFNDMIERLVRDEYVMRGRGKLLYVTEKGRREIPTGPVHDMGKYVPAPAPPRRAGSSTNHIPSMAGGRTIPYRPHV